MARERGPSGRTAGTRNRMLVGFSALSVAAALLLPAVPQPLDYHHFADRRDLYGIENFLDVFSNAGFLLVGLVGLAVVVRATTVFERPAERVPYAVFFAGMVLTALGSAYYHLSPDNERLFWDRLPMTIAFMSLVSAQLVDRVAPRVGLALLPPLLLLGVASVVYWRATERAGVGNVLPYAVLQGYSVVMLAVFAVSHPSRYTRGSDIWWVFGGYVLAKVFEAVDHQAYHAVHLVSGHTLKHLIAAVAGAVVCAMLARRTLRPSLALPV